VAGVAVGAPIMAAVASQTNYGTGIWASAFASLLGIGFLLRAFLRRDDDVKSAVSVGSAGPRR